MRTEREQDRPSEPAASKAETEKRTPATREKLAEQLDELDATERVLARYSKGARGRKTASARTPAAATKGERTPATRTRSAPRAPGTQNKPEAEAAIEALKSWAGEDIPLGLVLTGPEKRKIVALAEKHAARIGVHLTDVDAILKRLDQGIAAEHAAMDRLLERIVSRTPR
jgi:hypothetical protein